MEFIKLSNKLITQGHEQYLTPDELYVYILLNMQTNYMKEICTTVSVLDANATIRFNNQTARNVKKITEIIQSLAQKEVIKIEFTDDKKDIFSFNKNDVFFVWIEEPTTEFTILNIDKFKKLKNVYYLYVTVATDRWKNADCFVCSYEEWAILLDCSLSHAKQTIKEMVESRLLYKIVGDYNESGKQDTNKYKTTPFNAEEKTISTRKFEQKLAMKEEEQELSKLESTDKTNDITAENIETELITLDVEQVIKSYNNFLNKNSKLTKKDIVFYLEILFLKEFGEEHYSTTLSDFDKKFSQLACTRISRIKSTQEGKKSINALFERASWDFEYLVKTKYDDLYILDDTGFLEPFRKTTDKTTKVLKINKKTDESLDDLFEDCDF